MEEKMKEVELSLRNVKLLLREKDAHLKEQVRWTGYSGTERVKHAYVRLYICGQVTVSSDFSSCRRMGKQTC